MPIVGQFGSLAGLGSLILPGGAFESIATITVGSGGASEIDFTSIPGTYQHLQIRFLGRDARSIVSQMYLRYNGDSAANYTEHQLAGNGASASAYGLGGITFNTTSLGGAAASGQQMAAVVIDIMDYSSTSKFKTMRAFGGADNNGSGSVRLDSGLWMSTAAITAIRLSAFAPNFAQHTTAALYGLRAP